MLRKLSFSLKVSKSFQKKVYDAITFLQNLQVLYKIATLSFATNQEASFYFSFIYLYVFLPRTL